MTDPVFYGKPLRFNPNNHRYYWDDQPVPSVTTILRRLDKPALIQWAADMAVDHVERELLLPAWDKENLRLPGPGLCNEILNAARKAHATIRDDAGDVGTIVHKYARAMLEGKEPLKVESVPIQAYKAISAFHGWMKEHKVEPIAVERRVFSRQSMYAGTLDFYGKLDDEHALLDFKTGNGVYDEAWFQMGGYEDALREELESVTPMAHWIIHLNKNTGEFAAYRRGPLETHAATSVWRALVSLDKCIRQMPKMPKAKRAA